MRAFITELLHRHGDEVPIFSHRNTVTHGLLRADVTAHALRFAAVGIGDGSTVAVQVPPSFSQLEAVLALWSIGAQVISIDHRLRPAETHVLHELTRPEFLVHPGGTPAQGFQERYGLVAERVDGLPAASPHRLVQFSSGSTGRPKVIGRSTSSLIDEVTRFSASDGMVRRGERLLLLNSPAHSFGLIGGLLHSLAAGVHLVFAASPNAEDILSCARTHEVDFVTGLPFHFDLLASSPDRDALRTVRGAFAGGEMMPQDVADRFLATYGFPVGECFGTTETGALTIAVSGTVRPSVGRPMQGITARVRNGLVEVALPETPYLAENDPARFSGGWFRTGDRGEFTADGELRLLGRADSLVVVRGNKVDLTEVEHVLRGHPQVTEVVAVGRTEIRAYVGTRSTTLTAQALSQWCTERLAEFKLPARIHVMETLPRTSSGKIIRNMEPLHASYLQAHLAGNNGED
ncbi:Acyl-CoA synthetase (AMP-forming)/AMP-acid ligase II [Lentzea albidocapillata subsp. violacea]|uniref:Acyl-CoA synthetase (AMP-forming)/AMP-acid ligase II n=1 Tax=Lentzea albidocapillata subsp. violacea TaxID=128104 RepID=A0A1G9I3V3_9PSEU|nr:class I adenylate-forming enzyme family protein [Lentzea albidocapillata]SDL19918.1 Acyl-CoA synthetase (AMP-forming)/AMP-acid ligase II [Lentzea albidocapillata subsp. violacea]